MRPTLSGHSFQETQIVMWASSPHRGSREHRASLALPESGRLSWQRLRDAEACGEVRMVRNQSLPAGLSNQLGYV